MSLKNLTTQLCKGAYLGKVEESFTASDIVISKTLYTEKVYEGWHSHENHHITLVLSGGNTEQRRSSESEVLPGKVLCYHAGEQHRNMNTLHPSKNINLEISDLFFSLYGIETSSLDFRITKNLNAKFILLKIYEECRANGNLDHSKAAIHSMLLSLVETKEQNIKLNPPPSWINKIKEIVHDRWNEPLSLTELSEVAGVHPVSISKLFPQYFELNLGEYQRKLKLEKALVLLRQSNRSLTEVAYECGFFDQSHFIKIFKRATGFSPKYYKNL